MKKRRLKKGCWYIIIPFLAMAAIALFYLFTYLINEAGNACTKNVPAPPAKTIKKTPEEPKPTAQQIAFDNNLKEEINRFLHSPLRLDTGEIAVSVFNLSTNRTVFSYRDSMRLPPASCLKIATAVAALETLGMNSRLYSSLQIRGNMRGDTLVGNLLLRADADPLLESFDTLTTQLRQHGICHIRGNIYLNIAKEDTLVPHPTCKYWDIPYHKVPILLKGRKRIMKDLIASLHAKGISFESDGKVNPQKPNYKIVARSSHLLRDVITPMIIHSSNIKADALMHHLDWKTGRITDGCTHFDIKHYTEVWMEKTFGRKKMAAIEPDSTRALDSFVINDGSGLSPDNRLSACFLVDILKRVYKNVPMRNYFMNEALASPGIPERMGSLQTRLAQPQYRNRLFCKTGTMVTVGTSALAGFIHAYNGQWYVFSIINTNSPVAESRIFQDKICKIIIGKSNH